MINIKKCTTRVQNILVTESYHFDLLNGPLIHTVSVANEHLSTFGLGGNATNQLYAVCFLFLLTISESLVLPISGRFRGLKVVVF